MLFCHTNVHRCGCAVRASQAPCAFGASAERGWAGERPAFRHCPHPAGCWPRCSLQHRPAGNGGENETTKLCPIKSVWKVIPIFHAPCAQYDHDRVSMLANRLVQKIMSAIPDVILNGDPEQRYPGIVSQKELQKNKTKHHTSYLMEQPSVPWYRLFLNFCFSRVYQPVLCLCGGRESADGAEGCRPVIWKVRHTISKCCSLDINQLSIRPEECELLFSFYSTCS